MANNGSITKLIPNQPNAMATRFAHLEVLVTSMASSMATQLKPSTPMLGNYSAQGFDLKFFLWG
jgi:hypothetical protein